MCSGVARRARKVAKRTTYGYRVLMMYDKDHKLCVGNCGGGQGACRRRRGVDSGCDQYGACSVERTGCACRDFALDVLLLRRQVVRRVRHRRARAWGTRRLRTAGTQRRVVWACSNGPSARAR